MTAKCIALFEGERMVHITRERDEVAARMVRSKGYRYVPKSLWKWEVRASTMPVEELYLQEDVVVSVGE